MKTSFKFHFINQKSMSKEEKNQLFFSIKTHMPKNPILDSLVWSEAKWKKQKICWLKVKIEKIASDDKKASYWFKGVK